MICIMMNNKSIKIQISERLCCIKVAIKNEKTLFKMSNLTIRFIYSINFISEIFFKMARS